MIAVLVVIVLFVKVLEQFGLIEAGLEGKGVLFRGLSFFSGPRTLSQRGHLRAGCEAGPEPPPERSAPRWLPARAVEVAGLLSRGKNTRILHTAPVNLEVKQREMP